MTPGPSKQRLPPSDKKVQRAQPRKRKRKRDNDMIEESYGVFLRGLTLSENSPVYKGKDGKQHRYDESTDQSRSDSDMEGSLRPPPPRGRMTPEQCSEGERDEQRVQTSYHDNVEEPYNKFLGGLRLSGNSLVYEGKNGNQLRYDESIDQSRSDSPNDIMIPEQHSEGERREESVQTPFHDNVDEHYAVFLHGLTTSHRGKDGN